MQRNNNESNMTIVAIFRAGDPLRSVVQGYAAGKRYPVVSYRHVYEAIGRMPLPRQGESYLVTARPEVFEAGAAVAFESLLRSGSVHFAVWQDRRQPFFGLPETICSGGLHCIETIDHFNAVIHSVAAAQPRVAGAPILTGPTLMLPNEPLTEDEMDALLGVGL